MPKITYEVRRFREESLKMIERSNEIIAEYQAQGFTLTLRQLYYQFVARDLLPNSQKSYAKLGAVVNSGRMAGMIDWDAIEDRTRNVQSNSHWTSPGEIIDACASQYRRDLWAHQAVRPEVWIEKEALVGVIAAVCNELDVSYFACRGYVSQSEQWRAGRRFLQRKQRSDQRTLVLHFGDHDPSGIDMTRDNQDRLQMFGQYPEAIEVRRLALNMDQVEQFNPPPNFAKMTDTRFAAYVEQYGESSWELDALEPSMLVELIRENVIGVRDGEVYAEAIEQQEHERETLQRVARELEE